MARSILHIVAENPEIEHVSADVENSAVEEHGSEYGQNIIRQQVRPDGGRDEELLWYQRICVHEALPQTIGKRERPEED